MAADRVTDAIAKLAHLFRRMSATAASSAFAHMEEGEREGEAYSNGQSAAYADCADELEAALRAEAWAVGWLPIESAPRDGTAVILARGELVTYGHWAEPSTAGRPVHDRSGHVVDIEYDDWEALWVSWDCSITEESPPTHWCPLPEGPEVVGKWRCQSCYQLFPRGQHKECRPRPSQKD